MRSYTTKPNSSAALPTRRGLAKPSGGDPTVGRSGADCSRPRNGRFVQRTRVDSAAVVTERDG